MTNLHLRHVARRNAESRLRMAMASIYACMVGERVIIVCPDAVHAAETLRYITRMANLAEATVTVVAEGSNVRLDRSNPHDHREAHDAGA